jgi:hypothetical protein
MRQHPLLIQLIRHDGIHWNSLSHGLEHRNLGLTPAAGG